MSISPSSSSKTLALVGESGSGKTTIGRAVVGLIEATAGEIRFDGKKMGRGRDIRSNDIRGRIQLVFQEPAEIARSAHPRRRDHCGAPALSGNVPP